MRWFIQNHKKEYQTLREKSDLPAITSLLLANRGISFTQAQSFLHPGKKDLLDPFLFQEMPVAVDYLVECLVSQTPIRIAGDYDQDGVAATTILMKGLRFFAQKLGADPRTAVSYAIPDRVEDGYGLNPSIVQQAIREGAGLLVTVDNGIAAFEGLKVAQDVQLPVIVTDHHEPVIENGSFHRPFCEALLNPHVPTETYPYKNLCGAGVALKLIEGVAKEMGGEFPLHEELLGYAALGTICDMMKLDGENRTITALGLQALNHSENYGLRALLDENGWSGEITAYTVGFIIGPCINSSGRLSTARLGVELFLEEDPQVAQAYARELARLNTERKQMTQEGVAMALEQIGENPKDLVLAEYIPSLHESLCGLVAGRVKDRFHRPCLIFTDAAESGALKGSGRSIPAYAMFSSLNRYRDAYLSFGGHAMACGMTIRKKDFEALRTRWNQESGLTREDLVPTVDFDGILALRRLNADVMEEIGALSPYGKGNPQPLFAATHVHFFHPRLVGKKKNILQVEIESEGARFRGVAFQGDTILNQLQEHATPEQKRALPLLFQNQLVPLSFDILYQPEWNTFGNRTNLQLRLVDIRFSQV